MIVMPNQGVCLCSTKELHRLQNPALALAVRRERLRLTRLHAHLFRQHDGSGAEDPEVSLESFIWAHCLVRSRALDLTGTQVHWRCPTALMEDSVTVGELPYSEPYVTADASKQQE